VNVLSFAAWRRRKQLVIGATLVLVATTAIAIAVASRAARATPVAPPTCTAGTTVDTASGPVCGMVNNGMTDWLGIPYAAPPVGALRWQPPQPHAPWTTTLQAVQIPNACEQLGISSNGTVAPVPNVSEDCLYLNVIAPPNPSGTRLPVMVWIHGGGFQGGAGAFYDVTGLAKIGDVIGVSLNYRLGVLGFLADKAFGPHSGDYGLEDQQAALRWVKANIGSFGGDPNNVTIFGESAGGSSICDQMGSPTAAGLFKKAISESGEYNSVLGVPTGLQPQDCKATLPTEQQAQTAGATFAQNAGCGNATDVAACLRALPASTLLATAGGTNSPIINSTTLTLQLQQAFATGAFNRVKAIMGVLRDENLVATPTTAADYVADVNAQYGRFAPSVLARYPLSRYGNPYIAFRHVAADSDTVCPALRTDTKVSRWTKLYGYVNNDTDAPLGPLPGFPNRTVTNGAYHAADNQLIFDNWDLTPLDANQQALQDQMQAEWTAFARSGDPTTTDTPSWPAFSSAGHPVMSLEPGGDSQAQPESVLAATHNCAFWNSIGGQGG
jgi:para-nitrobenzyl esterase